MKNKDTAIRVLIADDDTNLKKIIRTELSEYGLYVSETNSGIDALELLDKEEYDVLLLDLNMPGMGGMDVLKKIKKSKIPIEVIILTGHATVSTAVEAMKLAAYDYLAKPFKMAELKAVIEKAYEKKKLITENMLLKTQLKKQLEFPSLITKNTIMLEIIETIKRIAASDLPVLIYGESGVGKELVARAVHDASDRSEYSFIPINCGAIPENMLESELFGHEKGAFTGAHAKKLGLMEIANKGTLFLDEIGELPQQLQVKLLRVLEKGVFYRVGGTKEIQVDVRFVSATNKELKKETENNRFRADLYYRISALTLNIPPLRERKDDIPLLVEYFIKTNRVSGQKKFSREALDAFSEYPWPGNVRELKNIIHRILLLTKDNTVRYSDLPSDMIKGNMKSGARLEDMERDYILKVLNDTGGQRGKAADMLGIDPKTLYRKLLSYGIKE